MSVEQEHEEHQYSNGWKEEGDQVTFCFPVMVEYLKITHLIIGGQNPCYY